VICHTVCFLKIYGSISLFSQQALEAAQSLRKNFYFRQTNRDGGIPKEDEDIESNDVALFQTMLKFYHLIYLQTWFACPLSSFRNIQLKAQLELYNLYDPPKV
jgi:hypothetical protein